MNIRKFTFLLIMPILFIIPLVSSEILISQPLSLYNVGDELDITINLIPSTDTSDFFIANLSCGETETEIYKSPITLKSGDQKEIPITLSLTKTLIGNQLGSCFIKTKFGIESDSSQDFEISENIIVNLNIKASVLDAGQSFQATGSAIKENSHTLNGFVELSSNSIGLDISGPVSEGIFDFELTIPENAKSGTHKLIALAYEKDFDGKVINNGYFETFLKVKQKIKEIDIAIDQQTIIPGNDVTYKILLFDQANDEANDEVLISIFKPDNSIFKENIVASSISNKLITEKNYDSGYWKIRSNYEDFSKERTVYIEELEEVSYELYNGTLIITNIGNVPFNKPVEISIGDEIKIIKLKLNKGESKTLVLSAPDGEYLISVGDRNGENQLGTAFLTGRAISIDEKFVGISLLTWIIIIVAIIILILFYILVKKKVKKVKPGAETKKGFSSPFKKSNINNNNSDTGIMANHAISSGIDRGEKQETAVISLKINEKSESVTNALLLAKGKNAKIYTDDNFRIIILSKSLTKTTDNNFSAIKLAKEMEKILLHGKVDFGLGVHSGYMIIEKKGDKFKFTSLANTISIAKRVSSNSKNEILISEAIHRKTASSVKTEKIKDQNFFKVKRIIDREANSDFLHRFKSRNKS